MTQNVNSFVLGVDPYPGWFKDVSQQGRVEYIYGEENELSLVRITNSTGVVTAKIGDTLIQQGTTIVVVPKDAAEKYMGG